MNKAIALITVLIIALLLFMLVAVFLFIATNSRRINERYYENLLSLALAEAGVDFAVWEINFGDADFREIEGWSGTNPKTKTISNFQDMEGNVYGNIDISVYNPKSDEITVIATGSLNSITGPVVSRTIRVVLVPHKLFEYAILTTDSIAVSGAASKIDSYDSTLGPYGDDNISDNGDIVTNGQDDPAITISGAASVDGDAVTGPDGTVLMEGAAELSGTTSNNADVFIPPVVVPDELLYAGSGGPLALNKEEDPPVTLTTGNYKYDYLDLSGKAALVLDGDVNLYFTESPSINTEAQSRIIVRNGEANIYFDGDVMLAGQGVLNEDSNPADLTLYGTDTVEIISISGIGEFFGTFYAPTADYFYITGNSEIYGAVVGGNVEVLGSAIIHYDENLAVEGGPTLGFDPSLWQEKY